MTWAALADAHSVYFGALGVAVVGIVLYGLDTVRHAVLARYNLQIAATRATQEEYLVEQLGPLLEEHRSLLLDDPIHRAALARSVAKHLVKG